MFSSPFVKQTHSKQETSRVRASAPLSSSTSPAFNVPDTVLLTEGELPSSLTESHFEVLRYPNSPREALYLLFIYWAYHTNCLSLLGRPYLSLYHLLPILHCLLVLHIVIWHLVQILRCSSCSIFSSVMWFFIRYLLSCRIGS